jgi:hypothetical protein
MTVGFAAAAAFLITSAAAYAACKVALAGIATGMSVVLPPTSYVLISYCIPTNLAGCLTAILIGDAVITFYDYWRQTLGVAITLAKG